jgi:hypothetical protein
MELKGMATLLPIAPTAMIDMPPATMIVMAPAAMIATPPTKCGRITRCGDGSMNSSSRTDQVRVWVLRSVLWIVTSLGF